MRETVQTRISRLKARKQELLEQMKALRADPGVRNREFKIARLNDQVLKVGDKIIELRGRIAIGKTD